MRSIKTFEWILECYPKSHPPPHLSSILPSAIPAKVPQLSLLAIPVVVKQTNGGNPIVQILKKETTKIYAKNYFRCIHLVI